MKNTIAQNSREFYFTDKDFAHIAKLVMENVGIVLKEHKKDMVYSRIARRLRALGFKSVKEYLEYLGGPNGDDEISNFVNAVTTNLTKFFRESHHFDHFREELLGKHGVSAGKRYRIWSAGCSSGMEPYSLAMVVRDTLPNIDRYDFKILATDIDTNMLDKGKAGVYRESDAENIPKPLFNKYVAKNKSSEAKSNEVVMADELKKLIAFKRLNFLEKWPMKGAFDVIFCRNVVIYFDKDTQRVLFDRFADLMVDGGLLYIGHSENLSGITERFKLEGKTVYRKVK